MYEINWESADNSSNNDDYPIKILLVPEHGSFYPHSHTFYEIVYVQEGFCLHFTDNEGNLLMAGDLIAIAPGRGHYYRCRDNVNIVNIMFLPEALAEVMNEVQKLPGMSDFFDGNPNMILHTSLSFQDREHIKEIIKILLDERDCKLPGWMLRSKALLIDIIVMMSRVFESQFLNRQSQNPYVNNIMLAMKMIEKEYANKLTVNDIALSLGIGPDHFTRQFKKITGFTPSEYLRRYRFAKALELLRIPKPIGEVSRETGFQNINYFSREFKAFFNMTPTEFQKQARTY